MRKPNKSKTKSKTKTSKRINNRKKNKSKETNKQTKSDNKQQQDQRKQTTKPTKENIPASARTTKQQAKTKTQRKTALFCIATTRKKIITTQEKYHHQHITPDNRKHTHNKNTQPKNTPAHFHAVPVSSQTSWQNLVTVSWVTTNHITSITLTQNLTAFYWIQFSKKKSDWLICPGHAFSGVGHGFYPEGVVEVANPQSEFLFLKVSIF